MNKPCLSPPNDNDDLAFPCCYEAGPNLHAPRSLSVLALKISFMNVPFHFATASNTALRSNRNAPNLDHYRASTATKHEITHNLGN
jgi:hypothetical protein